MGTFDVSLTPNSATISFFSQYAQAQATATQQAQQGASGGGATQAFQPVSGGSVNAHTITLTYTPSQGQSSGAVPVGTAAATSSLPVIASVQSSPTWSINFDIVYAPNVDGFVQQLSYAQQARQSIGQTFVGFHVNEFGMAASPLTVDAIIIFNATPYTQVQKFFKFLQVQKATSPLYTNAVGGILRYFDNYLGRSFVITLESVELGEQVTLQNMAALSLRASILKDYSNPVPASQYNSNNTGLLSGGPTFNPAGVLQFEGANGPITANSIADAAGLGIG